jgi:hypothetical protein
MSRTPTPWIGLIALAAMFVIPFLPDWLFEGPRTIKHWPRRHICGDCSAPWTERHRCAPLAGTTASPLHGELRRVQQSNSLAARQQPAGQRSCRRVKVLDPPG